MSVARLSVSAVVVLLRPDTRHLAAFQDREECVRETISVQHGEPITILRFGQAVIMHVRIGGESALLLKMFPALQLKPGSRLY